MAFFDDLALIEWTTPWATVGTGYTDIPYPNESTYIQFRCDQEVQSATLTYQMTEREVY